MGAELLEQCSTEAGREGVHQSFGKNLRCVSASLTTTCWWSPSNNLNSFNTVWLSCAESVQHPCSIPRGRVTAVPFLSGFGPAAAEGSGGWGSWRRAWESSPEPSAGCRWRGKAIPPGPGLWQGEACWWPTFGRMRCMCRGSLGWLTSTTAGESVWHH